MEKSKENNNKKHSNSPDDVGVARQLLQKHDLAERPLRVGGAAERVEDFLQGDCVARAAVYGPPDDAVGLGFEFKEGFGDFLEEQGEKREPGREGEFFFEGARSTPRILLKPTVLHFASLSRFPLLGSSCPPFLPLFSAPKRESTYTLPDALLDVILCPHGAVDVVDGGIAAHRVVDAPRGGTEKKRMDSPPLRGGTALWRRSRCARQAPRAEQP